jgi:hypothetical protein
MQPLGSGLRARIQTFQGRLSDDFLPDHHYLQSLFTMTIYQEVVKLIVAEGSLILDSLMGDPLRTEVNHPPCHGLGLTLDWA